MKFSQILVIIGFLFFAACTSENEKETLLSQEVAIEKYITAQMKLPDSVKAWSVTSNDGSYRLIYREGLGTAVEPGDSVIFKYVASIFKNGHDSNGWYDTNVASLDTVRTNGSGLYPKYDLGRGIAGMGYYIPGLDKGLIGMKEGEESEIVFSAAHGYGNKSMGVIPPLSPLIFTIALERIKKN